MSRLSATVIDVGWGDSLLIESENAAGHKFHALVDSNDTTYNRSSYIFVKRFFERAGKELPDDKPIFDFVLLSHAHTDHGQGLKSIMRDFGTREFWYPKSANLGSMAYLVSYANLSTNVGHHQAIDQERQLPRLGDAELRVLWPPEDYMDTDNENDNSVVLAIQLGDVAFVLTGDAEADVWEAVATDIPSQTRFFKVPHHGSVNGTFGPHNSTPWLDNCPSDTCFGISAHIRPFAHPHDEVIRTLDQDPRSYYRTDLQYHLTFTTDGHDVTVTRSHA